MSSVMRHLIGAQEWARQSLHAPVAAERVSALNVARMTLATVVSVLAARACGLPEQFWAVVTTVLVMQSSLGAAWEVSLQRLIGTVIGGATGAVWITWFRFEFVFLPFRIGGDQRVIGSLKNNFGAFATDRPEGSVGVYEIEGII